MSTTTTSGAPSVLPFPVSARAGDATYIVPARTRMITITPRRSPRVARRMAPGHPRAASREHGRSWRDAIQSFAHETTEMPMIARLLAGQGILLLGSACAYGALAMRRHLRGAPMVYPGALDSPPRAAQRAHPVLAGATAAMWLAFTGAALAFVARTRVLPAVTILFTYGRALRQYVRPLRRPARAA